MTFTIETPTDGLIAYYRFNGNANDESGNGNTGTLHGATLTIDRFGNENKAYYFNGASTISVSDDPSLNISKPNGQITVSIWAKKTGNNSTGHLIGKRTLCRNFQYQIAFDSIGNSGGIGFGWGGIAYNSQYSYWYEGVFNFPFNFWSHFVGTFDGTTWKFYRNGVKVGSNKAVLTDAIIDDLLIGCSGTCQNFIGLLDDIGIWKRELTEPEIQQLYHEGGWK